MAEMFLIGHVLMNVAILLAETQVASTRLDRRYSVNPDKSIGGLSPYAVCISDAAFQRSLSFHFSCPNFTTTKSNLFCLLSITQDIRVGPAVSLPALDRGMMSA